MSPARRGTRAGPTRPRALRAGSRIALVAPAGPLTAERIDASCERCRFLGLEPIVFPAARARHRYMAGEDSLRLADLQGALADPSIDGIWALRGGYGTLRILDALDLGRQRSDPIPFIGFSDNTSIHVRHAALGVVSFHGPHPGGDFPSETEESFRRALFAAEPPGRLPSRPGDPLTRTVVSGCAEGPLIGGNLSILAAMCGTPHVVRARGCVLFLEDVGEPAYRVDRMLNQLRASGALDGVRGLAFGRFTGGPTDDSHPVSDVLVDLAEQLAVPAVVDLPFGHTPHNCTLPVGVRALLDGDRATLDLIEAAVR